MSEDPVERIQRRVTREGALADTFARHPTKTIASRQDPAMDDALLAHLAALSARPLDERVVMHEPLGEGGMGVVHRAEQVSMGRHVAVKTVRADKLGSDAALRALREAWVTGALEHPNIVPVYDVSLSADAQTPRIMMKRIEGSAWSTLMADPDQVRARFAAEDPVEWNLRVLESVCNAVDFAHSRGILHRDLKPENVMIGAFGEVYVLDWGLAIGLDPDPSGRIPDRALATEIVGTPAYMAPEMLTQDPALLSPRTDVYLLGAILFELFEGAPPHQAPSLQGIIANIVTSQPSFSRGFPPEARAIVERAMARDPGARFESVSALRDAVRAYLRHRGSRRLAADAHRSLDRLLELLATEPASEARSIAVFNLLGECRFGYRAALQAWPENAAAREGLDKALLAVIESEVAQGDPIAAQTLLREMHAPPSELSARVERAAHARAAEDDRLRRIAEDHDPRTGTRTRTFISVIFGLVWTAIPLWGAIAARRGTPPRLAGLLALNTLFTVMTLGLGAWARDTVRRTHINRALFATLLTSMLFQFVLLAGGWLAGAPLETTLLFCVFTWALTKLPIALWADRRFIWLPIVDGLFFLLAARWRGALLWLMSASNLLFTITVVRLWLPAGGLDALRESLHARRPPARSVRASRRRERAE
jgi:serine/threonine protein kinase